MSAAKKHEHEEHGSPQPGTVVSPGIEKTAAAQPAPQALPEPQPEAVAPQSDGFSWTAPEFISQPKSAAWYLGLALGAAAGSVIIYLVTKDVISVAVVIVAAMVFGVYGGGRPKEIQYRLDLAGFTAGNKRHLFGEYKSFSVMPEEDAFASITLMPLKRFSTIATIYFKPEDQDQILGILSGVLPYEEPRRDAVDSLMRRLKF